jgi:hypothetical protein
MSLALRTPAIENTAPASREDPVASNDNVIVYHDDGLLAVTGPIIAACYALFFTIAALTFFKSAPAFFAVVVSIGFALVYFSIPALMLRIRARSDERWHENEEDMSANATVDVWTGPMRRWEAIVQIVSIPVAIVAAYAVLCFRWSGL